MYTLANKTYVLSSSKYVSLFFDKIDDTYRELKEERFDCIRKFLADKISHMAESHYRLTSREKEEVRTIVDSLFSIKEQLQDSDK